VPSKYSQKLPKIELKNIDEGGYVQSSGVSVTITIFGDFHPFMAKKLAFPLKPMWQPVFLPK
jgi:hypothetical protein